MALPQALSAPGTFRRLATRYPVAASAAGGIALAVALLPFRVDYAQRVFALVAIGGGIPLVWGTVRNIAAGRFHVDLIAALAIIGSVALGEFTAGALVVLMQSGGEALEDYGLRRANYSLEQLLRRAPSIAHCRRGDDFVDVPAGELVVGDTILVRPGDIIAVDGVVVEGQGSVDEAALTGEPVPLAKQPGDRVFSGTINLVGSLQVRATSTAAQSKYELIVRIVQRAQGERAPINRLANRYAPVFTFLALSVALLTLLWHREWVHALAVLVVATPCPLIIATPLAVLSAINRAAALNIIVKSGAAIEEAGRVDTVVFDKTGTLTTGEPELSEVRCFAGAPPFNSPDTVLRSAAGVELLSPHVLASAIVCAARARGLPLVPASGVVEAPGTGIGGTVEGHRWILGSGRYVSRQGVEVPEERRLERASLGADGRSVAYVAVDRQLVGMLIFVDRLRPEAPAMMHRLQRLGIRRTVMLTGDAPETARVIADQVGIPDVRARLQPEEKLASIRDLEQDPSGRGAIMMVGDGINDAPALASAGVGVAMGGYGAGIATDAADIVITVENVERVADTIEVGRRMVTVARQGILFGIGVSFILMVLAGLGQIPPALGALLQEALDLATILNALRAR
jgi:heavy metal translocating P-type ATPase